MAICYPLPMLSMNRVTHNATYGTAVDSSTSIWIAFPEEVERRMADILKPYGFDADSEDLPDAEHFLGQIEYMCRDESSRFPWAIIFCAAEYPLADHLLSIRPNREIRFAHYSMFHPHSLKQDDAMVSTTPQLSILFIFSKGALMKAAETDSPLVREVARILADKPETENWVVIDDPLDPNWVRKLSPRKTNC